MSTPDVVYLEELQKQLAKLAEIQNTISLAEEEETTIKKQISQWKKINNVSFYEVRDTNGQIWQLRDIEQTRKSVVDWDVLKNTLGNSYPTLIQENQINFGTVKKLKEFSKEWKDILKS